MALDMFIGPALGGALIGLAAWILYLFAGRIAGISGILGNLLPPKSRSDASWRLLFVLGLLGGGALMLLVMPDQFQVLRGHPSTFRTVLAGLLVGLGTRLGSGCTSGHGVCGMARLSKRSIVATLTFMFAAAVTVWLVRVLELGQSMKGMG